MRVGGVVVEDGDGHGANVDSGELIVGDQGDGDQGGGTLGARIRWGGE